MLALVLLVGFRPALAQQTGTLDGFVTRPGGEPLAGVAVGVESPALLQPRMAYSGGDGYWRMPGLPPGTYRLRFDLDGFASEVLEDVVVNVGHTYSIDVNMRTLEVEETVSVTARSPVVDTGAANLGGVYTTDLLDNIPNSRDYYDTIRSMPGVNEAGPGTADRRLVTVHGSSVRGNVYAVDGIDISDPVHGYASTNIGYEQIAEIEVKTGGMPAEIGSADGGYINIVTKSGGNAFSGEGGFYFQNDALQSDNVEATAELAAQGFERGTGIDSAVDASAALGGPIVEERAWFFASARALRNDNIVIGADDPVVVDENHYFAKGTVQLHPEHQAVIWYNRFERIEPSFGIGRFTQPEATYQRDESVNTWSTQWNGAFGRSAYGDVRVGQSNRFFPLLFQDDATRAFFDLATGITSGSAVVQRKNQRDRTQASGSVTYFAQDVGGTSHELKFGFEYERSRFTFDIDGGGPGGVNAFYYSLAGDPFIVGLLRTPLITKAAIDRIGLYAQDRIRVGDLAVDIGVRLDDLEGWRPQQGFEGNQWTPLGISDVFDPVVFPETRNEIDWRNVAFRIGVAYDLRGDGRTVVRGFYGRYYNQLIILYFDFANPNGFGGTAHFFNDANGDTFVQPNELSDVIQTVRGGSRGIDPRLEQPYTDEFSAGIEHELFTNFAVGFNFIVKRQRHLIEDANVGVPFDTGYDPVHRTDPGPDQTLGTGDDRQITVFEVRPEFLGQDSFVLLNPDEAKRDYEAIELTLNKRMSDDWQLFGSFVYEDSTGNVDTSFGGSTGLSDDFDDPNQRINDEGDLDLERQYQLKLQATYLAPYGINLSGYYRFLSGQPRTRMLRYTDLNQGSTTIFAEPRGSSRLDDQSILDFRVEKQLDLGAAARVGLMADVFNLTNESAVVDQGFVTGTNLGEIIAITPPRIVRFGARITW